MAPFIQLAGRPRLVGVAALVAGSLLAIALGQAHGQPRLAPAASRHAAVTIQRASTTAAGQIARPVAPARAAPPAHAAPLMSWHPVVTSNQNGGDEHHHHHGHHGDG
ncbi:MAG TPA: hypothetical protein VID73_00055 [Ktedonobacterales bacterium]|jgi:hypothetical protein